MFEVAKRKLKISNSNFAMALDIPLPEPLALMGVIEFFKQNSLKMAQLPSEKNLNELKGIVYRAYEKNGDINSIPKKYLKDLPFLLPKIDSIAIRHLIIQKISTIETRRLLRREISVYFLNYGTDRFIKDLRSDIHRKLLNYTGADSFFSLLKGNMYLFNSNCVDEALSQCCTKGFFNYFKELQFDSMLIATGFAKLVLEELFKRNNIKFNLKNRIDLFVDIFDMPTNRNSYQDILPNIIGKLILQIEQDNSVNKDKYKDVLRRRVLEFLGDPRITGNNKANEWVRAGQKAKMVFIRWISQYDLDLFFTIIDRSLTLNAKKMWKYRKAFWDSYREHISMIWVCFGAYAKMDIRRNRALGKDIFYGDFVPNDKSCLIIELGDYIFIERSHNGRLKVWPKGSCPFKIGEASITETSLNYKEGLYIDENDGWRHDGSVSYSWQKKVGAFINQYCRIKKTEKDWRP